MTPKYTNALINETSPYLLQHAHNPVHWEAWHPEVLKRAQKENKPLLVSIGYAACHWCHVMEHECFESEEVAKIMNRYFIPIKIDREERPDVDHIYMDALQLMTGSGGWPLNIIALPDGRPFWGATYVKKENWMQVLEQLATLHQNEPEKVLDYAKNLAEGIKSINLIQNQENAAVLSLSQLDVAVQKWSANFDIQMGGYQRAPKFMMPNNLDFLLHYATLRKDKSVVDHVNTTLTKMAYGGIYDHIGGGFARYAVDTKWHVPHFEKMLYDNGQLISLYAKAYAATKNALYKKVAEETIAFCTSSLMGPDYAFYSSLDADSQNYEGVLEEGAFYVWTENELKSSLGPHFELFKAYYNCNDYGHWEHGKYVLIRNASDKEIAERFTITPEDLNQTITECKELLRNERDKRNQPRLDDKILTSWNALMLKGLLEAYRYIGNTAYLDLALKNADFIENKLKREDGGLFRNYKNGKGSINAFLEDYASVIAAFLTLYQVVFDEKWLFRAKELQDYCLAHFFDSESRLFFFTPKNEEFIIRRTIETYDNVISSSNAISASNLFLLSRFFPEENYEALSLNMIATMQGDLLKNPRSYAHWLHVVLYQNIPFYEIAIVGPTYLEKAKEIGAHYIPNSVLAATRQNSSIALLKHRFSEDNSWIYACVQGVCKLPEKEVAQVLQTIAQEH